MKGFYIALFIIISWVSLITYLLVGYEISWQNPLTYCFILLQTHLYTGVFITAHDAMHRIVCKNKQLNNAIGWICATLFAFNYYKLLNQKHHLHHRFVATEKDPDYYNGNFWIWYYHFVRQYITLWQMILMAITYNALIVFFPTENVILYWMLPSILSTFQLFYFGTYLPHRGEHDNEHYSHSQTNNHFIAFITCYFFGYHYEHHNSPATPWWLLWKEKEKGEMAKKIS
jgi:beta-carotene ketolase (CrtW type)